MRGAAAAEPRRKKSKPSPDGAAKQQHKDEFEKMLEWQLKALRISGFVREFVFHPTRKFRFDFAFPDSNLAVEVNGGLYSFGSHSRGAGIERDYARHAEAMMLGWSVLLVSPNQVKSGQAAKWIESILEFKRKLRLL